MFNWKLIKEIYTYDGTFDGLLTIAFDSYINKTLPTNIVSEDKYQNNILEKKIYIQTDYNKSKRIFNGIAKNISYDVLYNSYNAFLCEFPKKEINILKYICNGFIIGPQINNMLSLDYVLNVNLMKKRAFGECHRLKGLLRFIEIGNNIYYSQVHPDNNIIEPLGQHFIRRFPRQNFIIQDKNRNIIFIYNQKKYEIINNLEFEIPEISPTEEKYQKLWRIFFNTISIKERKNLKCQMHYMPKKYWKDLIEKPI